VEEAMKRGLLRVTRRASLGMIWIVSIGMFLGIVRLYEQAKLNARLGNAIATGNIECVWQCLDRGADPDGTEVDPILWDCNFLSFILYEYTRSHPHPRPLIFGVIERTHITDSALVTAKADIMPDLYTIDANLSSFSILKALIAHGANINVRDSCGRTPLMYAVSSSNTKLCRLLLAAGARAELKDNYGTDANAMCREESICTLLHCYAGSTRWNDRATSRKTQP
jgi:ankyrin repeat protein